MSVTDYYETHREELYQLLEDLCRMGSPSGQERPKTEFCKAWLAKRGVESFIDDTDTLLYEGNLTDPRGCTVFMAHTDTVFPDASLTPVLEGEILHCPGSSDNTANLAIMLLLICYLQEQGSTQNLVFAATSGEEGLGNLRGARSVFGRYKGRVRQAVGFDLCYPGIAKQAVGSRRFEITVRAPGGHSFSDFGNENAIVSLSELIQRLSVLPPCAGETTTLNIGTIQGGTTINSIPQQAKMTYEFRSVFEENLERMQQWMEGEIGEAVTRGRNITVESLGIRPATGTPEPTAWEQLVRAATQAVEHQSGMKAEISPCSTDCNIPLSLDIPAVTLGLCNGNGAHTREEWVDRQSLLVGFSIAVELVQTLLKQA